MKTNKVSWGLVLGSLGVVYGDIGTSPLYALRETLGGFKFSVVDVFGILSLIIWSLILVISIKYLLIVFRADNEGEGGILALLALFKQKEKSKLFYLLAIFGAGLLIGDGMLTPAISVSSAMEGLKMISPHFNELSRILSCLILIFIFAYQSKGTGKIGKAFGPIILIWFVTIACLGVVQIIKYPLVLQALNPYYAYKFFYNNGTQSFLLLGGVFLAITGGEALYADIGSFGKGSIRYSWFLIVFPCLILNYLGQGANLILHPEAIDNPFYTLAPHWFFYPLLIIATLATVIASQAVISATFSLTKQAILLGLCPKLPIIQTSKEHSGQVYISQINGLLLVGTLILIYTFKNSSELAHAYGIAVNLDMLMVCTMVFYASIKLWGWSLPRAISIFSVFLIIDFSFLTANAHKFLTGGWMPVGFAIFIAFIMHTWNLGLNYLKASLSHEEGKLAATIKQLHYKTMRKLPNLTAIFLTDTYDIKGACFLNFLKLNLAIPENILIMNYTVHNKPHIRLAQRYELEQIDEKIHKLTLHYGFMDNISVPKSLAQLNESKLIDYQVNTDSVTYLVEIPHIVASRRRKTLTFYWQEKVFSFLMRNYSSNLNIEFYKLPHNRTIAIGTYFVI